MREPPDGPPVEIRLGHALDNAEETLAIAETCTAGDVSSLVTDVPGASAYFDRGFIAYSYDSLRDDLGVEREALDEHGVVSAPVTRQLARRARDQANVTWGLSTTGVAGPTGGSAETPVGTAYLGVAYAGSWESEASYATAERREFDGDRGSIREQIARSALAFLLQHVESTDGPRI